jgi:hypothetical protein
MGDCSRSPIRLRLSSVTESAGALAYQIGEITMPKFYFHFQEGGRTVADEEGSEFSDLDAAREEAIQTARDLLSQAIRFGTAEVPDALVITDRAGRTLDAVPLVSVLPKALRTRV